MDKKKAKLIFMGTPEISAKLLEELILDGFNFVAVVTKVDSPQGRKQVLTAPPVKNVALKYDIPVFQFQKVRLEYQTLLPLSADAIVCLAYGQIIPMELIEAMPLGCLNFHGSLLPKYRGAAPLQRAIMNGEEVSGVTAMEMVKEMDAGVMYAKKEVPISLTDTYTAYRDKFIDAVIPFAKETIPRYLNKELIGVLQDEREVTFAHMIKKEEQHLSLNYDKKTFINMVKGLSEEPGGYLLLGDVKLKIYFASDYSDDIKTKSGTINNCDKNGVILQLKDGEISLDVLQLPGKNKQSAKEFANGHKNLVANQLL